MVSEKITFLVRVNLISAITVIGRTAVIVMYFSCRRIQCITVTHSFLNRFDACAESKALAKNVFPIELYVLNLQSELSVKRDISTTDNKSSHPTDCSQTNICVTVEVQLTNK